MIESELGRQLRLLAVKHGVNKLNQELKDIRAELPVLNIFRELQRREVTIIPQSRSS